MTDATRLIPTISSSTIGYLAVVQSSDLVGDLGEMADHPRTRLLGVALTESTENLEVPIDCPGIAPSTSVDSARISSPSPVDASSSETSTRLRAPFAIAR